jgi:hypothetical protein
MMTEVNESNGYILMERIGNDDNNKNENNLDESAMDIEKGDDEHVATLAEAVADFEDLLNNDVQKTNEDSSEDEVEDNSKDDDEEYKQDDE